MQTRMGGWEMRSHQWNVYPDRYDKAVLYADCKYTDCNTQTKYTDIRYTDNRYTDNIQIEYSFL